MAYTSMALLKKLKRTLETDLHKLGFLKEKVDHILQDLNMALRWSHYVDDMKSRDILNIIRFSKPELSQADDQLRLIFHTERKHKKQAPSVLDRHLTDRNVLAHSVTVDVVYNLFDSHELYCAVVEVLRARLSKPEIANLSQLPKSDLMALITGIPGPLLKHAFGTLIFRFSLIVG